MKSQEAIKTLKECCIDGVYYISQETGLYLIEEYVFELKSYKIPIDPPKDIFQLQLYDTMLDKIFNYYLTE